MSAVHLTSQCHQHTFASDIDDLTRLQPADQIGLSLGYAFALNDTLTLSTAVSGSFTGRTKFDTLELPGQEQFSLRFGMTSYLAKGLYIEPSISFGLTGPIDHFVFGVTLPYRF